MGNTCSIHERDEKCIQHLVRKAEGKRPHRRPSYRGEDSIKMDLREVGCGLDSSG